MFSNFSGAHLLIVLVVLALEVLTVVAIVLTAIDTRLRVADKVAWILVLVVLPMVGLIVWFVVRMIRRRNPTPV